MRNYIVLLTTALTGLFATACGKDGGKKSTTTGTPISATANGRHVCISVKDATISYTSTETCQAGFIKVENVENTGGPIDVPVEL